MPHAVPGDAGPEPAGTPRRVAILGLGVMGGSLARALCALEPRPRVVGWSPDVREAEGAFFHARVRLPAQATFRQLSRI